MRTQRRSRVMEPNTEDVTAVELAQKANINPKAFRRGSKEHQTLECVLEELILKSRS